MEEKPFESMNVIPFVDIMLVLLTIVLTTSSFIASGTWPRLTLLEAFVKPRRRLFSLFWNPSTMKILTCVSVCGRPTACSTARVTRLCGRSALK